MKTLWLLGMLTLTGLTGLSAQTPDDDCLAGPKPGFSDELELAVLDHMIFAQASGGDHRIHGPGSDHRTGGLGGRQRKHLEQLRMLKMLELLELGEDQEVEFLIAFNAMRRNQRQLEETSQIMTDSLAQELRAGNASETRLNSLIDRVLALQNEKQQQRLDFVEQSRAMLTAEQIGKLVIFQKRFESELLERIGRFRKGMGPGPAGPEKLPEDDG